MNKIFEKNKYMKMKKNFFFFYEVNKTFIFFLNKNNVNSYLFFNLLEIS
jgi:hypothetical protein